MDPIPVSMLVGKRSRTETSVIRSAEAAPSVEESTSNALQGAGTPYLFRLPPEIYRGVQNNEPGIFQFLTQNEINNLRILSRDKHLDKQAVEFFNNDRFSFNMRHFKTNEQLTPFLRHIKDIKTLKITGLNYDSSDLLRQSLSELGAEFKFKHMESLDLSYQEIGEDTFLDIHTHFLSRISSLTSLNLLRNKIGADGAESIAGSKHLASLTSLNLGNNQIRAAGAEAIAGSEHLASLTSLNLSQNGIGDAGIEAIRARFPFAKVYV